MVGQSKAYLYSEVPEYKDGELYRTLFIKQDKKTGEKDISILAGLPLLKEWYGD